MLKSLTNRSLRSPPPVAVETAPVPIAGQARLSLMDDIEATGMGWFWATDADGHVTYMTEAAVAVLGADSGIIGGMFSELFETDPDNPDGRSDRTLNFQMRTRGKLHDLVVRRARRFGVLDDGALWWEISAQPKLDGEGNFLGYRGSARDVTVAYERKREDMRLAEHDSLTGLSNRHRMDRKLEQTLAAFATTRRCCTLMMLDLDRFKQVNDTMGHQAGDELLKEVANRLRRLIGTKGEIGRLGGDEFQILLLDVEDRGVLGDLAQRIVQVVSQPYPIDGKRAIIGTSVGVAVAPYDGADKEELVRSADLALYAAKNGGRGQFRFYSSDLKDEEAERRQLTEDLTAALDRDELQLFYQPVVRATDDTVVGCEALMRWEHPERGPVSPGVFIPVAEESSLINRLGEWALRRACADALHWPATVRVAVNVSALQFAHEGFTQMVTGVLDDSGLSPQRLELELTESVFMGDSETIEATFVALKELGVRLALDDFGTGYSSLSYLRTAPFDKLKVDKSFVDSCTAKDQNSAKIIAAIIGLSRALGMETTVEGVEAFDQFELVRSIGAELIQGHLYSRALPAAELTAMIDTGAMKIRPEGPDRFRPERRTVFKRIGIIHDDHRYEAVMRDLSKTGARIEGMVGVPEGTGLVIDLSGGQLVVSRVIRSQDAMMGVEFETPLVNDGSGGLCTRHRVSAYALAAAGMPMRANANGEMVAMPTAAAGSTPRFVQVNVAAGR